VGSYGPGKKTASEATIKRARELRDQGLTFVQIGTRLGYSVSTIRKLINGERKERDPRASWKTAAKRIGCSLEEYTEHREAGERWCTICRTWKHEAEMKPRQSQCLPCASASSRKK
jgi:transcriptional regulator with XRE-family HTH domain